MTRGKAALSDDFSKFTNTVKSDYATVSSDAKTAGSWWLNYGNPVGVLYNAGKDAGQIPAALKMMLVV